MIFTIGLTLFALGGLANAVLFNATGVLLFMVCLLLGRPLHDIAYFPSKCKSSTRSPRSSTATSSPTFSIRNLDFTSAVSPAASCLLLLANNVSDTFALRYALLIIGVVQMLSVPMAQRVLRGCNETGQTSVNKQVVVPVSVVA